jgi:hypothetical protein
VGPLPPPFSFRLVAPVNFRGLWLAAGKRVVRLGSHIFSRGRVRGETSPFVPECKPQRHQQPSPHYDQQYATRRNRCLTDLKAAVGELVIPVLGSDVLVLDADEPGTGAIFTLMMMMMT